MTHSRMARLLGILRPLVIVAVASVAGSTHAKEHPRFTPLGDAFVVFSNQRQLAGAAIRVGAWRASARGPSVARANLRMDSWVPIASASKWYSAVVIARLVEQGALRWDSTVGDFLPEAPRSRHAT
ncbi:MAG: beta-lactamase family protein [Aquincola sp.]|nr:beta-lactamase family protein [Aquincola sp.]